MKTNFNRIFNELFENRVDFLFVQIAPEGRNCARRRDIAIDTAPLSFLEDKGTSREGRIMTDEIPH